MKSQTPLFLFSAAVFGLLILLSPVVSTLLLGLHLQIIFAAPIIATALAATYLVAFPIKYSEKRMWELGMLVLIFTIGLFLSFTKIQMVLDQEVFQLASVSQKNLIEGLVGPVYQSASTFVLFLMVLPFSMYALLLVILLNKEEAHLRAKLYAFEMLGALVGTLFVALSLEKLSFEFALSGIFIFLVAGIFTLSYKKWQKIFIITIGIILVLILVVKKSVFEPQRDLHLVGRDFHQEAKIDLLKESWTTFSKVQTLKGEKEGRQYLVTAIGDGTGLSILRNFKIRPKKSAMPFATMIKTLDPNAKSIAVLFAGGGSDLLDLDILFESKTNLLGIEINSEVLNHAKEIGGIDYHNFIQKPNIELVRSEARHFLNHNKRKFDVILYSWSGATMAHYAGALLHTTQYAFTKEALQNALNSLDDNGVLMIAGTSKINLILSLRELGIKSLSESVVIMSKSDIPYNLKLTWDDLILIVRKKPFLPNEVDDLDKILSPNWRVALSPFKTQLPEISNLLKDGNIDSDLLKLRSISHVYWDSFSDDKPFVNTGESNNEALTTNFWLRGLQDLLSPQALKSRMALVWLSLIISLFCFIYIFYKKRDYRYVSLNLSSYLCGWVGAGLQICIMFKLILYIPNPTIALIIGIGGYMLGAGVGAFLIKKIPFTVLIGISFIAGIILFFFMSELNLLALISLFLIFTFSFGGVFPFMLEQGKDSMKSIFVLDAWGAASSVLFISILLESCGSIMTARFLGLLFIFTLTFLLLSLKKSSKF